MCGYRIYVSKQLSIIIFQNYYYYLELTVKKYGPHAVKANTYFSSFYYEILLSFVFVRFTIRFTNAEGQITSGVRDNFRPHLFLSVVLLVSQTNGRAENTPR